MKDLIHSITGFLAGLDKKFLIQFITFVTVVLILDVWERMRPGYKVDRNSDLVLNILALFIVIFTGDILKKIVMSGYKLVHLDVLLAHNQLALLPGGLKMVLAIAFYDFSLYWVHRLMHGKLFWRTHSFHHTIAEIWWLAGTRASLIHLLMFAVPQILIGYLLFQLSPLQLGVTLSFQILVNLWLHANIWVNLGVFEYIFITPKFHRIHHGAKGLTNTNLGFVFPWWDMLFGTYANPRTIGRDFALFPVLIKKRLPRMLIGL
jgi:sterol desaturase/sphingolipid hydroxylase (fatty acid hydroxylase superfamily)